MNEGITAVWTIIWSNGTLAKWQQCRDPEAYPNSGLLEIAILSRIDSLVHGPGIVVPDGLNWGVMADFNGTPDAMRIVLSRPDEDIAAEMRGLRENVEARAWVMDLRHEVGPLYPEAWRDRAAECGCDLGAQF